eukprot:TRINITY_DN4869_c0_g1_i1.p1 TRINITY_DN4869_c0_g1~~TRINITY_DN4869_c0_g1_i1.p1  ORF type:complete len:223 (+),score=43.51 TRINITY_DN4869_c0_g1_i1:466-1134(+)
MDMSPKDDVFISGGLDETVRFWDLRTNICQGILRKKGMVAFDPQGLVFAVATDPNLVKLYNIKELSRGPFSDLVVNHGMGSINWAGIKFSNDGMHIVLWTELCLVFVIDAFKGDRLFDFNVRGDNNWNPCPPSIDASFTPDSQYVLAGCPSASIQIWSVAQRKKVAEWSGHAGPVNYVRWNPKYSMAVSSDENGCLAFWLPDPNQYLNEQTPISTPEISTLK